MEQKIIAILSEISGEKNFELEDNLIFILGFDSKKVMQLVVKLENEFDISIDEEDLDIDNFKNVNAIKGMISKYITAEES